jgi:hypothetical protein
VRSLAPLLLCTLVSSALAEKAAPRSWLRRVEAEARRHVDSFGPALREHGFYFELQSDAVGLLVYLHHGLPQCSSSRRLAHREGDEERWGVGAAELAGKMFKEAVSGDLCRGAALSTEKRLDKLERDIHWGMIFEVAPTVLLMLKATALYATALNSKDGNDDLRYTMPAAISMSLISGLAIDSSWSSTLGNAGNFVFWAAAGADVYRAHDPGSSMSQFGLALSLSTAATAGLFVADRWLHETISARRLYLDQRDAKRALSESELIKLENRRRRTVTPTSPWILAGPLFAGSGAMLWIASDAPTDQQRFGLLAAAGLTASVGVAMGLLGRRSGASARRSGIDIFLSPLGVGGTF